MSLEDPTTQEEWLEEFSEGGAGETEENFEDDEEGNVHNVTVIGSMFWTQCFCCWLGKKCLLQGLFFIAGSLNCCFNRRMGNSGAAHYSFLFP